MKRCYVPLLSTAWVLDVDTTVKTLFGNQEGAEIGYNPRKPGRLSHSYHTYSIANLRKYAVLITSLSGGISSITQLYRDRADCENTFDEIKNQWAGGFTALDLRRFRLMARTIALIYNWWNIFVRLAQPKKHLEVISSRPLLMHGVAKQTMHAGKSKIKVSSQHGKSGMIQLFLGRITSFFNELKSIAEQLTKPEIWSRILSKAVEKYLNGNPLKPPICLT